MTRRCYSSIINVGHTTPINNAGKAEDKAGHPHTTPYITNITGCVFNHRSYDLT